MVRQYHRKLGISFMNYTQENLEKAVRDVRNRRRSIRQASEYYNIPKSTICDKVNRQHDRKQGGQTALAEAEEKLLVTGIQKFADWGFPLTRRDIRLLVKNYLDRKGIKIKQFKENFPGSEWFHSFMNRHKNLTERLAQNIKRNRANIDRGVVSQYFNNLRETLANVPPSNIVNYDETNMSDDPGRVKVLCKRGSKYVDRIMDSSKTSTSIMLAISASGNLLPPYIVYKAAHIYQSWMEDGVNGAVYNRTKSGWFDGPTFEDWFAKVAVPYFKTVQGKKVVIGDNLASHISLHVLETCEKYDIEFVLLPPNSTHLLQPLDVAYFAPMKKAWRKVLSEWKEKHKGCIPKSEFPRLLKNTLDNIASSSKTNIESGFRATGLYPLNPNIVLKKIPEVDLENNETTIWSKTFEALLKDKRFVESPNKPRGKKIRVAPGQSVKLNAIRPPSPSSSSSEEENLSASSFEEDTSLSSSSSKDLRSSIENKEQQGGVVENAAKDAIKKDSFVLVKLTNPKQTVFKYYVGCIEEILDVNTFMVNFLRKQSSAKMGEFFIYPQVKDESIVERKQIMEVLSRVKNLRRERFQFKITSNVVVQ